VGSARDAKKTARKFTRRRLERLTTRQAFLAPFAGNLTSDARFPA
jgi:hypothetical protein